MAMKQINVAKATGPALDWLVAKCEGLTLVLDPMGFRKDAPDSPQAGWWVWLAQPGSMIVGYAPESNKSHRGYSPSTDWAQGGPIIEREFITNGPHQVKGEVVGSCALGLKTDWSYGPTPLIAAMRCRVVSQLGPTAEVPEELL